MSENTIPHEGRFLQALGVNPDVVMRDTTRLEWKNGQPILFFTSAQPISAVALAGALMAASQEAEQTGPTEPTEDTPAEEGAEQEGEEGGTD